VDVFPDGEHFAIVLPGEEGEVGRRPPSITVVENWIEEFERR